jgi:DNA-binding protein HU-beta/integration host factor subunit alpha
MNNKEFIAELSRQTGYKSDQTQKMVNSVLTTMGDCFMEGDSVMIPGFGTFDVKKKLERIIVSPGTGQRMLVPPKLVLGFKPSTVWKEKVKNNGGNE